MKAREQEEGCPADLRLTWQDIQDMGSEDLEINKAILKRDIFRVQTQLEDWNAHILNKDDEWRDRASKAYNVKRNIMQMINIRLAQLAKERVARGPSLQERRFKAFVSAVRQEIGADRVQRIWEQCAKADPEAFR